MQKSVANRKFVHKIKFELSKLSLILHREYQKSGIDSADKQKSLNCRNSLYSSRKSSSWSSGRRWGQCWATFAIELQCCV